RAENVHFGVAKPCDSRGQSHGRIAAWYLSGAPSLKVAIVAGFFEPIRRALEGRFAKQMEVSSLVWIPQVSDGREPDIGRLGASLSSQLKNGAKHVLVLVAILAGKGWVKECV